YSQESAPHGEAVSAMILRPRRLRTFQTPQRLLRQPHQLFSLALFLKLQASGLVVFHFLRPPLAQGVAVALDVDRLAVLENIHRVRGGPDLGLPRVADALSARGDPRAFRQLRLERQRQLTLPAVALNGRH